ncbi:hypothetical protein MMPV_002771 [Pyropia vietnamensis]
MGSEIARPPKAARLVVSFVTISALFIFCSGHPAAAATPPHAKWTPAGAEAGFNGEVSTKWCGALIADLDGDGWDDLILNNHDKTPLRLYWNNRRGDGASEQPSTLFQRAPDPLGFLIDAHGQTAGDIFLTGTAATLVMQGGANGDELATPRLLRSYGGNRRRLEQAQRATGLEGDSGGRGRSPLLVDLDGDGDLDLITLNYEKTPQPGPRQRVYENVGGKFKRRHGTGLEEAGVEYAVLTDLDNDGRMDVVAFPFFRLYRATGSFAFADVTDEWMRQVPGGATAGRNTWAAAELDANNDGKWDLFLARNSQPDVLLLNTGSSFMSAPLPPTSTHHGDVTVGDFNNDGAMDIFLSSTASATTPRLRRDVLLSGNGRGGFSLAPAAAHGVAVRTAAGGDSVQAFDADRDGRLDLLIGSGGQVAALGPPGGWDLFMNTIPLPEQGGGHWLAVSVGRSVGRSAAASGATLRLTVVTCGGDDPNGCPRRTLYRRVGGAGGRGSTDCLRVVHFGLGTADRVVELVVRWSDGSVVVRRDVPIDSLYSVTAA